MFGNNTTIKIFFEYLGYLAIITSIISSLIYVVLKYRTHRKLIKFLSERWQNKIKGKWFSYNITYIDNKKEITAYEWNFEYKFWKSIYTGSGQSLRDENVT